MMIFLFILGYIVAMIIYCLINHKRIGTVEQSWGDYGPEEHNIDTVTIAFKSVFWWLYLFVYALFSPILICEFIIRKYHEKHNH